MQIFTRSLNEELYKKMVSLIPPDEDKVELKRVTGFNQNEDCLNYLLHILEIGKGWIVNIDEDCFIYEWSKILSLINFMNDNSYDYAGMPDGGACSMRHRSWVAMNPFFNIFNTDRIRPFLDDKDSILNSLYDISMEDKKPRFVDMKRVYHHRVSPFNCLFTFLINRLRPLYLRPIDHEDGLSTILLDNKDNPLCVHTWYSREYNNDPYQKARIDRVFKRVSNK